MPHIEYSLTLNAGVSTCTRVTPEGGGAGSPRRPPSRARSRPSEPAGSRSALPGDPVRAPGATAGPPAEVSRRMSVACVSQAIQQPPATSHEREEQHGGRQRSRDMPPDHPGHDRLERVADKDAEHDGDDHRLQIFQHQNDGEHRQQCQRGIPDLDRWGAQKWGRSLTRPTGALFLLELDDTFPSHLVELPRLQPVQCALQPRLSRST